MGVGQGVAQGREGLSAAGGDVQLKNAAGTGSKGSATVGDGLPCSVDGLVLGKAGEFLFQKSQLFGPDGTHILRLWGELDSIHKFSGVPAVSFNDGG